MIIRRLAILACAPAVACIPSTPPSAAVVRQATPVQASFGRTWDAVIDAFADQNVPIKTIDRSSGLIATDQLAAPMADSIDADCGTENGARLFPLHATYNVVVRGDSTASTVRVTVLWVSRSFFSPPRNIDCSTTGRWESALESAVKSKAEARVGR